jgi:hypothetical protein
MRIRAMNCTNSLAIDHLDAVHPQSFHVQNIFQIIEAFLDHVLVTVYLQCLSRGSLNLVVRNAWNLA